MVEASLDPPIRRRLYGLAFVDEFGPIYAVFTLWFNDNGISTAQISTLFLVWALISLVLEIPSGALADRVDRRYLLAAAFGIRAAGIALWFLWPTLTGVTIGVALWALHDALASGSWEAMIHDQLTAVGAGDRYTAVMARVGQFSHLGVAVGTLAGAGLLRADVTLVTLGWLTVAAHAGSIVLVATLPDARWAATIGDDEDDPAEAGGTDGGLATYWATLRAGLAQVAGTPNLAKLVGLGALLEGLFLIDEYVPLLTRARGGSDAAAPIIFLIVWIGLLVGGEIVARRPQVDGLVVGPALVAAMVVTAAAFLTREVWTLALVAIGYAVLVIADTVTDARLQERTDGRLRATVTSVRGFGSASVSMIMFAVIGLLADGDDPTPGILVMVGLLAAAGLLIVRWLPAQIRPSRQAAGG